MFGREIDKSEWVWGYERLGEFTLTKVILAVIFLVIALTVLHFAFNTWWDISAIEAGKNIVNEQPGKVTEGYDINRTLPSGQ